MLDAVRLEPLDDQTEVTAAQVRQVADRLREAGSGRGGIRRSWWCSTPATT
jgi:hypothetical protein